MCPAKLCCSCALIRILGNSFSCHILLGCWRLWQAHVQYVNHIAQYNKENIEVSSWIYWTRGFLYWRVFESTLYGRDNERATGATPKEITPPEVPSGYAAPVDDSHANRSTWHWVFGSVPRAPCTPAEIFCVIFSLESRSLERRSRAARLCRVDFVVSSIRYTPHHMLGVE